MFSKNGYYFYMDGILFPVAPSKMSTKHNNKNRVINLVNEGEVNILKESGLKEFSFEMLIPAQEYSFSRYVGGVFLPIQYFLTVLYTLKKRKKPFNFVVIREGSVGTIAFDNCLKVSLENYEIKEDAGNGKDVMVSITLKEFKDLYKNKVVKIDDKNVITKIRDSSTREIPTTIKVKDGDSLYSLAKKYLGDGEKYRELITKNNLNSISLKVGEVLKLV